MSEEEIKEMWKKYYEESKKYHEEKIKRGEESGATSMGAAVEWATRKYGGRISFPGKRF